MLVSIYTISFATSLGGLIAWFYYQDQPRISRWMSRLFVGGFFTYLFSLAFADGALGAKLFILFRDFMVLSLVALFFNVIQKHLYVFVAGLVLLYGGFRFGYSKIMSNSFKALSTSEQVSENVHSSSEAPNISELAENGEFLVELQEGIKPMDLRQELFMRGMRIDGVRGAFTPEAADETTLDDYVFLDISEKTNITSLLKYLDSSPLIEYYEPNEKIQLDDPSSGILEYRINKKGYFANDPDLDQSWSFSKLDVNQLHLDLNRKKVKPVKKALIAILDTGVDAKHEDLNGKYKSLGNKHDNDPVGHGTHCAGIAAAVSNNGKGIASFAPNNDYVEVTSIKVLNSFGGGTQGTIINGILKAADSGADVISMSLGGRSNPSRQRAYSKAVDYANKKGAIVVVAAGNSNMDAKNYAPANAKGVIAVSATDSNNDRASFSNKVANVGMGIAAPGVNIYSTTPNNEYKLFNGTSMAAPHVAGLVGIMKAIYPDIDTKGAFSILDKTGVKTNDTANTGKLIQPADAIDYLTKED